MNPIFKEKRIIIRLPAPPSGEGNGNENGKRRKKRKTRKKTAGRFAPGKERSTMQTKKTSAGVPTEKGRIVLDPGHGKTGNPHTTREGFYEGTQNFLLASYLQKELTARGYEVLCTRKTVDDDPDLAERGSLAGKTGAILFLSLHSNAPGTPADKEAELRYPTVRGVETYYSVTDPDRNARLAARLNAAVAKVMNTPDRGIKTRHYPDHPDWDYYGVIRSSAQSGCRCALLVEHGFHTNPEDSAFLQDEASLARLAAAEAEAIDAFFSAEKQ